MRFTAEQCSHLAAAALDGCLIAARKHRSKVITDALTEIAWLRAVIAYPGETHEVCDANMMIHGAITDPGACGACGAVPFTDDDEIETYVDEFNAVFDAVAGAARALLLKIHHAAGGDQ